MEWKTSRNINMSKRSEAVLILALLIFSFVFAIHYLRFQQPLRSYHIRYFEPAVLMACGHAFGIVQPPQSHQKLTDFLWQKTERFSCDDLPAAVQVDQHASMRSWFYMVWVVAQIWKVAGISWYSFDIFLAMLFMLASLALYGIFRLAVGPPLAIAGSVLFIYTKAHYQFIYSVRDYSKVAFIFTAIFLLGLLVTRVMRYRTQLIIVVLLGLCVGVGYGFRPDVIVLLPYIVLSILLFLPRISHISWGHKFLLILLLLSTATITALPMLLPQSADLGSCMFHFALLGVTDGNTQYIGLTPALYGFGYPQSDQASYVYVNSFAEHFLGQKNLIPCSHAFDAASFKLYWEIITTFPADMLARVYASVVSIFNSMRMMAWDKNLSLLLTTVLIMVLARKQMRIAIFMIFSIIYLLGYPAIYFELRHFFHLLFFYWWLLAVYLAFIFRAIYHADRSWRQKALLSATMKSRIVLIWQAIKPGVFLLTTTLVLLIAALWLTRLWQAQQLTALIKSYQAATKKELNYQLVPNFVHGKTLFKISWPTTLLSQWQRLQPEIQTHSKLLMLEIDSHACQQQQLDVHIHYQADKIYYYFPYTFKLDFSKEQSRYYQLYFPVYFTAGNIAAQGIQAHQDVPAGWGKPLGIEVPMQQASCIKHISEVDTQGLYPLILYLIVPDNWQKASWYRQLTQF